MRKKLVYLLPEYREDIGTHFYHNYEFLLRVQNEIDIYLIIERGTKPDGFNHVYLQLFHFFPLRVAELFFVFLALRLNGYKIFWTHYSFFGAIVAPIFGKSFYWNCGMPWLYKRSATEEYFFRLALRRSLLVTGTDGMKKKYSERYGLKPQRIFVLPNWINIERFAGWRGKREEARERLGIEQDAKVVLFLHHLSKRKGADMIMPVAAGFENDPKVIFLVAGAGPLGDRISKKNIKLVGEIPQHDVPMYMAAADIFFMPSEEEGFPHVLLEAMAIGVPIVASDVGGVREIVPQELKDFVIPQDPDLFAEKIKQILNDPSLAKKLSESEQKWVERYSLEKIQKQFLELIQRD